MFPLLRGRALQTRGGGVQPPTGCVIKTWCPPHLRHRWGLKSDVRLTFPLNLDVRLTHRYIRPFILRSHSILWCPPAVGNKYYTNVPGIYFAVTPYSVVSAYGGQLILLRIYRPLYFAVTPYSVVSAYGGQLILLCIYRSLYFAVTPLLCGNVLNYSVRLVQHLILEFKKKNPGH